jgi:hypothetical protein
MYLKMFPTKFECRKPSAQQTAYSPSFISASSEKKTYSPSKHITDNNCLKFCGYVYENNGQHIK